jgi:hypothetical protein
VARVLGSAEECGFDVRLYQFENIRKLDLTSGLHFGLILAKPTARSTGELSVARAASTMRQLEHGD